MIYTLIAIYVALAAVMWFAQRHLMYMPEVDIQPPAAYGLADFEDIRLTADDGVKVQAWLHRARADWPTILYFHGNGGHLGYRKNIYRTLADAGFGVLALSYRGYGASEGSPTETGLFADAKAAYAYAKETLGLPGSKIIVYGESLGTAVAVKIASEREVAMVQLKAPFTSARERAADIYYWLPVKLLIRDPYDSASRIKDVHAPLVIMHGDSDVTIPPSYGRRLFELANAPKKMVVFPGVGHNDFDPRAVTKELVAFGQAMKVVP